MEPRAPEIDNALESVLNRRSLYPSLAINVLPVGDLQRRSRRHLHRSVSTLGFPHDAYTSHRTCTGHSLNTLPWRRVDRKAEFVYTGAPQEFWMEGRTREVYILCTRGLNTRDQVLSPQWFRHKRVTPGRRRQMIFHSGLLHGLVA